MIDVITNDLSQHEVTKCFLKLFLKSIHGKKCTDLTLDISWATLKGGKKKKKENEKKNISA